MIENRQMNSRAVTERVEHFHWEDGTVAIDNGDAQHTACHGKEYEWLDEDSRKAERRKGQSISIHLSEILTNELHKYLYLYLYVLFIIHNQLNPPDWDLQGDHSLLQADNLRGIDPYSHKVYYLDDPVHLLVSCAKLW